MARSFSELRKKMSPERQERNETKAHEIVRQLPLYELRMARKLSQAQLAETLSVQQAAISKMEHRTDIYISTLRRYIQAMGGELAILAKFPDGEVSITMFRDIEEPPVNDEQMPLCEVR